MPESDLDTQWWLAIDGKTTGPHSQAYVLIGLKTGTIPSGTQACPVGRQEWKLLADWPEFKKAVAGMVPPPVAPSPAAVSQGLLTNSQLPTMGNLICVYTILVCPMLWFFNNVSCFMTGPTYQENSKLFDIEFGLLLIEALTSLALTILLVFGGLRLRGLRRSGSTLIKLGLWVGFAAGLFYGVVEISLFAIAEETDLTETTNFQDIITMFRVVVLLSDFIFAVTALIWLHLNTNTLPLRDQ